MHNLSLSDTGAQYSALADKSDTDYISEEEYLPEETQCHYHDTELKHIDLLQDGNPSTPVPQNLVPRQVIEEIIHHPPALQIPPVEITVVPGQHLNNQTVNLGIQRVQKVQGMAGRRNNQLQGADPASVRILQLMNYRDVKRDNAQKKFLMFPKESFTGTDKKLSQGHWAEFEKYLDYQQSQGIKQRGKPNIAEIQSMFRLTLQDIALGWFDSEAPNLQSKDELKQAFLKHFNLWGNTRRQQQDAWNKLNCLKEITIMKILMTSFLSREGSRCC